MMKKRHETQRGQILEAAESVVRSFGYAKTTMADIARAMRRGKSSLYHYFPSKEQIFVELLRKEIEDLKGEFLKAMEAESTPRDKIRAYVLTRTRMFRQKLEQHMAYVRETPERYDLLMKLHLAYDADEIRIVSEILADGAARGAFAVDDAATTAAAIVHVLKGFEYPYIQGAGEAELEEKLNCALRILFQGIEPR
jgi:AcrR family transcriptional regulator